MTMEAQKSAAKSSKSTFVWDDPFLMEEQLTDEERMIRDAAAAFAADKLAPRIDGCNVDFYAALRRTLQDTGVWKAPACAERTLTEGFEVVLKRVDQAPHESELKNLNRQGFAKWSPCGCAVAIPK